jgi:hypothetical protein
MTPRKRKVKKFQVLSAECSFWGIEDFLYSLEVLYEGLRVNISQFSRNKNLDLDQDSMNIDPQHWFTV